MQPVLKEDVAEVLRRRFFTPSRSGTARLSDRMSWRRSRASQTWTSRPSKEGKAAEERFLNSYPFHPDLTEVFYSKWTNLEGFQRTRGVLRTFALALREAEQWDTVAADRPPTSSWASRQSRGLSEAARELTSVADDRGVRRQDARSGRPSCEGELDKAREIQADTLACRHREMEQAVFATFLHSQPIGQRALTRELLVLVGHTRPDKIELEKALRRWSETSWFLDEAAMHDADVGAGWPRQLPKVVAAGLAPQPDPDAPRCLHPCAGSGGSAPARRDQQAPKSLTAGRRRHDRRARMVHMLPDASQRHRRQRRIPLCRAWSQGGFRSWQAQRRGAPLPGREDRRLTHRASTATPSS